MSVPVFLDTVGLIALWDEDDQWHDRASSAYSHLKYENPLWFTTSFVFLEFGNAAARKLFRNEVDEFRIRLENAGRLIIPTETDWRLAWASYRNGEAGNAGIVDQVSFIVMRRLGITRAFTNDRHFQAAGFETLF